MESHCKRKQRRGNADGIVWGAFSEICIFAAVAIATGLFASVASAQPARTFVASTGTDANPCSVAAPCRTLQRGIDAVASGGDVLIVDNGGFGGGVTITKSVSVIAPPGAQSRLKQAMDEQLGSNVGILVDGSDIAVSISGLGITGSGTAGTGVYFLNGKSLTLSGMDVDNVANGNAIAHTAGSGHLTMSDTVLRNGGYCFQAQGSSSAPARATILRTSAQSCALGFQASTSSNVAIMQTQIAGNANCAYGYRAYGTSAVMTLDSVVATGCFYGVNAALEATVSLSNSVLTGNANAGLADTSSFAVGRTFGNNRIFGNASDTLADFTSIAEQ